MPATGSFAGSPQAGITVTIDYAALHALMTAPGHDAHQWFTKKLFEIRNYAVMFAPVRTGRLRSSMHTRGPFAIGQYDLRGYVGSNVEYAYWVHEGRGPVRPVNKRVLRWVAPSGEVIFRPYAGPAQGNPFLQRALDAAL